MNTVTVLALGAQPQVITDQVFSTVQDIVDHLGLDSNLSVKVNGESSSYDASVPQVATVVFGEKVKGGNLTDAMDYTWDYANDHEVFLTNWSFVGEY